MNASQHTELTAQLLERIERLPVLDTHEHMLMEADFLKGRYDFSHLMSYVGLDLGLAGMRAAPWGGAQFAVREGERVEEKWQRIAPYWPYVRTGVYGRAYRRLLRLFFAVSDLDEQTIHGVSEGIARYQYPGVYAEYLHRRYGIVRSLQAHDHTPVPEPEHFVPVCVLDGLAGPYDAACARRALDVETLPAAFEDYRALLRARLDTALANGAAGLKIAGLARCRAIDFGPHTPQAIQDSYHFLREKADGDWLNPATCARLKPFQDAAFWAAFEWAGEHGLPVQVHSGLEFQQPWDGRPGALLPSLVRFPETQFAIFHGSYPHMDELTGLAKSFPNVYLDLAWFHLLSRHQARAWLAEWLDVLPHNKLFAFGGDVFLFFGICVHLELARENVADVLAARIADGLCDLDEAEHTARLLFYDNARRIFRLPETLPPASAG